MGKGKGWGCGSFFGSGNRTYIRMGWDGITGIIAMLFICPFEASESCWIYPLLLSLRRNMKCSIGNENHFLSPMLYPLMFISLWLLICHFDLKCRSDCSLY